MQELFLAAGAATNSAGHTPDEIAALVFIDIAIIVAVARLVGMAFRKLRQPPVIGEMLAGIMLGPSLLGQFPGDLPEKIFPLDVRPFLRVVAQLGLIIFMFIVGLELNVKLIKGKERAAATISLSSVVLPFSLGCLLALWLHQNHEVFTSTSTDGSVKSSEIELLPFALFIGASMSITAFPVLARILSERGMHKTQIGSLTLACAAVDDILAWAILAVVLAVEASTGALGLPLILLYSLVFVGVMFGVVKPLLKHLLVWFNEAGRLTPNILAIVIVGFLTSAYVTDKIGIHSIFGAFVFGVVMPREESEELFHEILEKLEQVSVLLLLPVFFISTGFNVDIGGIDGTGALELLAVLAVAIGGKFFGAAVAARAIGIRPRKASAIGILMNTRGLTELVILNVGLSVGVLTPELFTIFVIMALVTTIMTEPLLRLVYPDRLLARDIADAEREALGGIDAYRVVAVVDGGDADLPSVDAGVALLGDEAPAELLLSRFDPAQKRVEVGSGLLGELASVTASFEAMQGLVRRAAEGGAKAVVRSQFTDDPARDLVAQAAAVEADVVLLPTRDERHLTTAQRVVATSDCAVVLCVGSSPTRTALRRVVLLPGPGDDGSAAAEQAVRAVAGLAVPLELVDGGARRDSRRVGQLHERFAKAGVRSSVVGAMPDLGPGVLVVVGLEGFAEARTLDAVVADAASLGADAVLLVRATRDDRGDGLDRVLEALMTPAVPAQQEPSTTTD